MRQFEYDVVWVGDDPQNFRSTEPLVRRLNALGADGWEVLDRVRGTKTVGTMVESGWACLVKREVIVPMADIAEKPLSAPKPEGRPASLSKVMEKAEKK